MFAKQITPPSFIHEMKPTHSMDPKHPVGLIVNVTSFTAFLFFYFFYSGLHDYYTTKYSFPR
jgi:hypothetical protein